MLLKLYDLAHRPRLEIITQPGITLSEAIWLSSKIAKISLCAGQGLCGKCKVRFMNDVPAITVAEKKFFNEEELANGWRLGCQHTLNNDPSEKISLELPFNAFRQTEEDWENTFQQYQETRFATLGIDLGTTSIAWQAEMRDEPAIFLKGSAPNPQSATGADVISRILAASRGRAQLLANLVRDWIQNLLISLKEKNIEIKSICIAGNSAMSLILFERNVSNLAKAPYSLDWAGSEITRLPGIDCDIIIPPLPSPFIGGDISAGLNLLLKEGKSAPFILVDLGTNGELALYIDEKNIYFASVPMGPAMEGIGPAMGALPGEAVATDFRLGVTGVVPVDMADKPLASISGISATGYLSLLELLLKLGIINKEGKFAPDIQNLTPLAKKVLQGLNIREQTITLNNVVLSAHDIELLMMVKAAFSAALKILLKAAEITPERINKIFMAGALGQFIHYETLFALGFFPTLFINKLEAAGNTALRGACLLARDPAGLKKLAKICQKSKTIDLANMPEFQSAYINSINWHWN